MLLSERGTYMGGIGETVERSVFVEMRQVGGEHPYYENPDEGMNGKFSYEAEFYVHPPMDGAVELDGERAARQAWDGRTMWNGGTHYQYGGVQSVPETAELVGGPGAPRDERKPVTGNRFNIKLRYFTPEVADAYVNRLAAALLNLADTPSAERVYPIIKIDHR